MGKATTNHPTRQKFIAGLLKNDPNIEFFGIESTKTVQFTQNGRTHHFAELKGKAKLAVIEAYESDAPAKSILHEIKENGKYLSYARKVELYTYYCWGGFYGSPDLVDGVLQETENFRESTDCISLGFARKKLHLNGQPLKNREVKMIDLFLEDQKDYVVALDLGIAPSTLDQHKKELFNKAGVKTKPALMVRAMQEHLPLSNNQAV